MKTFQKFIITVLILITLRMNTVYSQWQGGLGLENLGFAIAGMAAVAAVSIGFPFMANELYLSPVISFYHSSPYEYYYNDSSILYQTNSKISPGLGAAIMVKKNFSHSDLEYGFRYITYNIETIWKDGQKNNNGQMIISTTQSKYSRHMWGVHINYIQHILYNKLPERIDIFLGPSINYFIHNFRESLFWDYYEREFPLGLGGIAGITYKIANGIKLDLRYELTSRSNQVQLGIRGLYRERKTAKKGN